MRALIEGGEADREAGSPVGEIALAIAAGPGHLGVVRALLDAGARAISDGDNICAVMHHSVAADRRGVIDIVWSRGGNEESLNAGDEPALSLGVAEAYAEGAVSLLDCGEEATCGFPCVGSAVALAAAWGRGECLARLVREGVPIDARRSKRQGSSPGWRWKEAMPDGEAPPEAWLCFRAGAPQGRQ